MKTIEAVCVVGGLAEVTLLARWKHRDSDIAWRNTTKEGHAVEYGICVRADQCPYRRECTHKVLASMPGGPELRSEGVIHELLVRDEAAFKKLEVGKILPRESVIWL